MGFFVGFTRFVDGLNDKIGSVIRWFTLAMVLVGAFNALARYAVRYTNVSLSSNGYLDLQWYLFSLIFLLGAAYGLNHDYHVRVDVFYSRMGKAGQAWIDLIGSLLLLIPFTILMLWVSWDPVGRSKRSLPIQAGYRDTQLKASFSFPLYCFSFKESVKL